MQHKVTALYDLRLRDEKAQVLTEQHHPATHAPLGWCNDAAAAVPGEAAAGVALSV